MDRQGPPSQDVGWTRGRLLRTLIGGGAIIAGTAAVSARSHSGTSLAAQSKDADAKILNFFLLLEYVQEGFYREAVETGRLTGELLEYATTVGEQESEHVAFLAEWLGSRARPRPKLSFQDSLATSERFRDTAIDLEEAALAGYIGQGANLTRDTITPVATLVSVEARQAAWVRDLAGVSPAPRAADPARDADRVVEDLRKRGYVA
jgi:hypothetical protein